MEAGSLFVYRNVVLDYDGFQVIDLVNAVDFAHGIRWNSNAPKRFPAQNVVLAQSSASVNR